MEPWPSPVTSEPLQGSGASVAASHHSEILQGEPASAAWKPWQSGGPPVAPCHLET